MLKLSVFGMLIISTLTLGNAIAADYVCQSERESCKMDRKQCSSSLNGTLPEIEQYITQVAMFQKCIRDFGLQSCQQADIELGFSGIGLKHAVQSLKIMCDPK